MSMYQGLILIILACKVLPLVTFITMNNKLFTFLDPLLGYIDKVVSSATLPLALCHLCRIELAVSYLYTGKGHRDGLLQICRREINPCFHSAVHYPLRRSMGKLSALDEPENKLKEAIQEENEFIAIPVVSHLTQTMGEWLGLYIGVIGTLCSVVIAIFAANEIRYILPIPSGMFFLMPIYGFLIVVFARLLAELYRALAVIANNTKKLTKTEAKAEAKLEDIEDIEEI